MFGFGKGKIEIQINKFNFSPGEVIEGAVTLKLKKPLNGREVSIRLIGQQETSQGYVAKSQYNIIDIFDFKQPLDGEKEYPAEQSLVYSFTIKIPENVLNQQTIPEGTLGKIANIMQVMSRTRSKISWYLIAKLDTPGLDVSKKVQINIA